MNESGRKITQHEPFVLSLSKHQSIVGESGRSFDKLIPAILTLRQAQGERKVPTLT